MPRPHPGQLERGASRPAGHCGAPGGIKRPVQVATQLGGEPEKWQYTNGRVCGKLRQPRLEDLAKANRLRNADDAAPLRDDDPTLPDAWRVAIAESAVATLCTSLALRSPSVKDGLGRRLSAQPYDQRVRAGVCDRGDLARLKSGRK